MHKHKNSGTGRRMLTLYRYFSRYMFLFAHEIQSLHLIGSIFYDYSFER